jgi:hypothetical protein
MNKGSRIQIDYDYGTVRGVGSDYVYVELDKPRTEGKNKQKHTFRHVFGRKVVTVGGIATAIWWTNKKEKRSKKCSTKQ